MSEDTKAAIDAVGRAFEEFKATNDARLAEIEKKSSADPLLREKLDRIDQTLSAYEGLNQRITQAEGKAKALQELDDRLAALEAKGGRPFRAGAGGDYKARVRAWADALFKSQTIGLPNMSAEEVKALDAGAVEWKALSNSNDTGAGYLAPVEMVYEIIKGVVEQSPMRSLVRVRTTMNKSIMIPTRTGTAAAQWVGETETRTETTGLAYGAEELPTHEMYALIDISRQNLDDAAFDMEAELRAEAAEQFAVAEGLALISGNGVKRPEGFLTRAAVSGSGVGNVNSGSATAITADGLFLLKYGVKTAYARNGTFILNRTTLRTVRTLKDTTNQYIWQPGLATGRPNTIDGDPYVECPDMPSEGAGNKPVAYGDWRRAMVLADRIGMNVLRDNLTQATSGNVRFHFYRRMGAQVVLGEAIATLTCST